MILHGPSCPELLRVETLADILRGEGIESYGLDPDPEAPRKVGEVMANARRAMTKLYMPSLPAEGTLTFVDTPEEAATDVQFVQESAPERMELKQMLLGRASAVAGPDVVFGSSTSGLLPSEMQQGRSGHSIRSSTQKQNQRQRA